MSDKDSDVVVVMIIIVVLDPGGSSPVLDPGGVLKNIFVY